MQWFAICYVQNNLLNNHFCYSYKVRLNYSTLANYKCWSNVITVNNMGNAKNKKNRNANHGKYQKKWFAAAARVNSITEISITE